MALVPARDHLGEFLLLLDSTNGRDKLCRFIQYSSKALKWRAEVEKQPEDTIKVGNENNNGRALMLGSASVGSFQHAAADCRFTHRSRPPLSPCPCLYRCGTS